MTAAPNPAHIIAVDDYTPATLRNLIAHLDASSSFEHCIYREAELDAVWRLLDIALQRGDASQLSVPQLEALRDATHAAHDLVAAEQPAAAAARLRRML